jgi:prepilin peptidase CpaA
MNHLTPSIVAAAVLSVLCLFLICAVWSDVRQRRISNAMVLAGSFVGIACNSALPEGNGFSSALPGALGFWGAAGGLMMGLGLMLPLFLLRAMGAGDAKLVAMVGAFLGLHAVVGVVLATFLIGGVMSLAVTLRNGSMGRLFGNLKTMLLGGFFKLMLNELPTVDAAVVSAGKLPYAVAIAGGTMAWVLLRHLNIDLP